MIYNTQIDHWIPSSLFSHLPLASKGVLFLIFLPWPICVCLHIDIPNIFSGNGRVLFIIKDFNISLFVFQFIYTSPVNLFTSFCPQTRKLAKWSLYIQRRKIILQLYHSPPPSLSSRNEINSKINFSIHAIQISQLKRKKHPLTINSHPQPPPFSPHPQSHQSPPLSLTPPPPHTLTTTRQPACLSKPASYPLPLPLPLLCLHLHQCHS